MARVFAVDPGTVALAWALYDTTHGLLETGLKRLLGDDVDDRCEQARAALVIFLPDGCNVDVVATERMFSSGRNSDAPLAVVAYLIRRRAKQLGLALVEMSPGTWKKRALGDGNGNAGKAAVKAWATAHFGRKFSSQDEADAACMAVAAVEDIEPAHDH